MPRAKQFDEGVALKKAMELFWRKGYHATSMQELVDHLGINRASLYDTFGGKRELFDRAVQLYRSSNTRALQTLLHQQTDTREGIRTLFRQAIENIAADTERKGCFLVNVATEMVPADPELQTLLRENRQGFEKLFHDYLMAGERRGDITPGKNLKSIAGLLFTLYNGLQVVSKMDAEPEHLMASVESVLDLLE